MKKSLLISALTLSCFAIAGCNTQQDTDTMNQISLLQGLTLWDYYWSVSIKELKTLGNIWLWTFEGLNGELIMLDWVVYRGNDKLEAEIPSDDTLIPFANITFLDKDHELKLENISTIEELKKQLDEKVNELGNHKFYMVRITWSFNTMHIRSEKKQEEPYKPLVDVLRVDQTEKTFNDISWDVVALYTPDYMSDLNAAGWHFHFISSDKKAWGHILNLDIKSANAIIDETEKFNLYIPNWEFFNWLNLTVDQNAAIKEVEQGQKKEE